EVERLVWAPLTGAGSLTDPRRRMRGILHGQPVGPVFDLPEGALVWGFTAMIAEQVLTGLGLDAVPLDAPVLERAPVRPRGAAARVPPWGSEAERRSPAAPAVCCPGCRLDRRRPGAGAPVGRQHANAPPASSPRRLSGPHRPGSQEHQIGTGSTCQAAR